MRLIVILFDLDYFLEEFLILFFGNDSSYKVFGHCIRGR